MSTTTPVHAGGGSTRRWVLWGFLVGAAITLPATILALLSPVGEAIHPYLVPAAALLAPASDAMATWPGLVNMTLGALVNGVVYAVAAGAVGALRSVTSRG